MLNGDLGRHLIVGKIILDTHQVPTRDLLSFTMAGQSRPPYEWLAQALFAMVYRLLNLDGVVLSSAFVIAVTFTLVYSDSMRRANAPLIALLLTLWAALASSLHWLARPHIFSFLFFAIGVGLLERFRKGEKVALWAFPALMLIWANTHGGFIFGLLAWLAYLAGWSWEYFHQSATLKTGKQFLLIGGMSLFSTIITPDLRHNWNAVLNNNSSYILSHTVETMPPDFHLPGLWPFAELLAVVIILGIAKAKSISLSHVFLLAGLALMSSIFARNIPFFAIASVPILADWVKQIFAKFNYWLKLEDAFSTIEKGLRGFLWPLVISFVTIGLFVYHSAQTQTSIYHFDTQTLPVQAADWLEAHPQPGNMFNDFNWGGYLLFRFWPAQRVFIDSQSDFYGEEFTRQYEQIFNGKKDWDAKLNQYNVSQIIVPRETGLALAAKQSTNWKIAYEDNITIILVKK